MNAFSLKVIAILDKIFEHTVPTLSCSNFTYKYEFIIALLNCAMPFFKKFHFTAYRSCRYSIVRKLLSYTGHSGLNFWAASGAITKKRSHSPYNFLNFLHWPRGFQKKVLFLTDYLLVSDLSAFSQWTKNKFKYPKLQTLFSEKSFLNHACLTLNWVTYLNSKILGYI